MFKRAFIRGLLTITPVVITIAILVWLYDVIEGFIGGLYQKWIGEQYYFPGLGILIAIVLIFIIGIIVNNWLIKKMVRGFENLISKVPFVKTLYNSTLDLLSFFKDNSKMSNSRVVVVKWGPTKILGLVSRETFQDLPKGLGEEGEVAVYIPLSYQIGGATVIIPKSMITPIDMGVEDGLRFAVTAGMPGNSKDEEENEPKK